MKEEPNNHPKTNVVIDIDLLGLGHVYPKARTGVFRVNEELLLLFLEHPKLNVYFSAIHHLSDSLTFLASKQIDYTDCFVHPVSDLKAAQRDNMFRQTLHRFKFLEKIYRRFYRRVLYRPTRIEKLPENSVFFSPYYALPNSIQHDGRVKKVLLIHDLISFKLPELFEESNRMDVHKSIASIDEHTLLAFVSESTKQDLQDFFPSVKNQKRVISLAASQKLFHYVENKAKIDHTLFKYKIPNRPYLLSLCTLEPRKNIESTIRAFNKLLKEHHEINASLVLVGTLGWQYKTILDEILNMGVVRDKLIITGYVSDEDLAAIYSGAAGFVYPSLYEGFGLPPLEAMQCGTPVIVSDSSSIPEVVGDAGIYVQPTDVLGIKDGMEKLLTDRIFAKELSLKSLEKAAEFSWAKSADKYVNIFQELTTS